MALYLESNSSNDFLSIDLMIGTEDAGCRVRATFGRMGRATKFPPQLGQTWCKRSFTQDVQNVHSNVQIMASKLSGGRDFAQCSQQGRSSSITADYLLKIGHQFYPIFLNDV